MPHAVAIVVNHDKPEARASAPVVAELLGRHASVIGEISGEADVPASPSEDAIASRATMLVVLGGDGTLLGAIRRFPRLAVPMLGVNFGKLGFLAEYDLESLGADAATIFGSSPPPVRTLPMIRAEVLDGRGRVRSSEAALNEAVITAGPPYRMVVLGLGINGEPGPQISGDGMIVCTPIGSTAYNVSAGGPIVPPDVDAMVVTPIAAHSLAFRPTLVSGSSRVELALRRANDADGHGTSLLLDGRVITRLSTGERVVVRRDTRRVQLVRNPGASYWDTLIGKLRWASQPGAEPP